MKYIIQAFLSLTVFGGSAFAQEKLPVLRTNKDVISVKEGKSLYRDTWTVVPETKPDVFVTNPFFGTTKIVFYSDIDSLFFTVTPNKKYDFVILLNGKDSAYTQIDTHTSAKPSLEPKLFYDRIMSKNNEGMDTIPFRIGKDNFIHIKGKINNSDSLDFIFDTGAGICAITSSLINKKVNIKLDGSTLNAGSDGISTVNTSSKNTIEIANLVWKNVPLISVDYKGFSFEIVLGWVAFENKIVEIDYEHEILVIHELLPYMSPEYSAVEMKIINGIPFIKCKLVVKGNQHEGWFDFDTGSDGTLIVGQKFAKDNQLNHSMRNLGTSKSRGSAGIESVLEKTLLPKLKIGDFEMYQIPMSIHRQDPKGVENNENIGNKILKRFNAIIDFRNNVVYLKPNNLFYTPM